MAFHAINGWKPVSKSNDTTKISYVVYDINVLQLPFSSSSILYALLGVSATHLLALTPNDWTIESASRFYFNKSLKQHCKALVDLNKQDVEALLALVYVHYLSYLA